MVDGREAGTGGAMHIAIDLGAGSGRALVGGAGAGGFALPRGAPLPLRAAAGRRAPAMGCQQPPRRDPSRSPARMQRRGRRGLVRRVGRRRFLGRRLRAPRQRGPPGRGADLLPRQPDGARDGRGVRRRAARRDLRAHRHPVPGVQHSLPVVVARARWPFRPGAPPAPHAGLLPPLPVRVPRRRADQRLDDAVAERGDQPMGRLALRAAGPASAPDGGHRRRPARPSGC